MINPENQLGEKIWIPELEKHATINGFLRVYMATADDGKFYHMVCSGIDSNWKNLTDEQEHCLKLLRKFQSDFFRGLLLDKKQNNK